MCNRREIIRCVWLLAAPALISAALATRAAAQSDAPADVPAHAARDDESPVIPTGAHLQTILARTGFSPGLIDAKPGRKTRMAVEHFQRSRGLEPTGEVDHATAAALLDAQQSLKLPRPTHPDDAPRHEWTRRSVVTSADLDSVTGPVPEDWNERAALDFSGYADIQDLLAERGWCSIALLRTLNPNVDFDAVSPGDEIILPDVDAHSTPLPAVARLEVNLTEKIVLGFDEHDQAVLLLHCSIARNIEHAPVGELHVKVIVTDPEYTFNPESWPEVTNVSSKLRIAPGPRNPVGLAWIGLDRPGFGIHGTVRPQDIGKTGSHGCFRLANWDAQRLAHAISVGTPVTVRE